MSSGDLPPYPGPTKTLSVNYTGGGEPFALADDVEDELDPRDVWRVARSLEDHQHGDGRGLPINRIGTATDPQVPGDIQAQGDNFRWWGDDTDQILSAVDRETNQTVNGTKRFNQPLLLPRQASAPAAPGVGLGYVYLGPGDRLFLRAGNNAPTPVGTPALLAAALNWNTNQQPGQPLLQRLGYSSPTWVLSYRSNLPEVATLSTVAPFTYGGTPISAYITWSCPAGTGKINFTLQARKAAIGDSLLGALTAVATLTLDAPDADHTHRQSVLQWTTGLPAPGDVLFYGLQRDTAAEAAAGTAFTGLVHVIDVGIVYG